MFVATPWGSLASLLYFIKLNRAIKMILSTPKFINIEIEGGKLIAQNRINQAYD